MCMWNPDISGEACPENEQKGLSPLKARRLSDVKKANQNLIFETIRHNPDTSISDLVFQTQMSRPTVTACVRDLEKESLICASGSSASVGGRTSVLYRVSANARYAIGVDCEFPPVRISIANLDYERIAQKTIQINAGVPSLDAVQMIAGAIEQLILSSGIDRNLCLGIGIGMPGQIDRDHNHSISVEKIPNWRDIPIGRLISDRLKMPVFLENDVNLLALAEYRINPFASAAQNRMLLYVRGGIGMGIIMEGSLLEGNMGNAGRIGHMSINAEGPRCICGNRGCLSLYVSGHAIVSDFQNASRLPVQSFRDVTNLADAGNREAVASLKKAGRYLGAASVGLTNLFDISYITVCAKGNPSYLAEEVRTSFEELTDHYRHRKMEIHAVEDTDDSFLLLGGCVLVVDHFIQSMTQSKI